MIDIRVGQLAQLLGVHRNTVTNWIKRGQLKATPTVGKRYLVEAAEFERFCKAVGIPAETMGKILPSEKPAAETAVSRPVPMLRTPLKSKAPIGAVMVVGGGIAGIQASLDLANSGYAVHLIERSPAIGGVMAQLDKTYPTNDCAM